MPVFRFNKTIRIPRGIRAFLKLKIGVVRKASKPTSRPVNSRGSRQNATNPKNNMRKAIKHGIQSKKQEVKSIEQEIRNAKDLTEKRERKKKKIEAQQELFQMQGELHAAKRHVPEDVPDSPTTSQIEKSADTSLPPDFIIIGAQKCGTTSLYRLLTRHPQVQFAALKELHYFDKHFDEEIEWYRRSFPPPRLREGRRTITRESTPAYIFQPLVPQRMAESLPEVRLIALLRNPVNRAYSHYHHQVRMGNVVLGFDEAIKAEAARLESESNGLHVEDHQAEQDLQQSSYLSRGIYVDQLIRWSKYFDDEQMLVLKSEEFFKNTPDTMKRVLNFLNLPDWTPPALGSRNTGSYMPMDPDTRRWLEDYFEPHNQRLYKYLGVDFDW